MALASVIADAALILFTFLFRNRQAALGAGVAIFDMAILLMTFGFYLFCMMREKMIGS